MSPNDERPIEVPSPTASVELARTLDADLLSRALSQLTPDQQQVIIMKFIEGYDNEHIAQTMDKREGAIRALQMRALLSLRRLLESQGEQAPGSARPSSPRTSCCWLKPSTRVSAPSATDPAPRMS